MIKKRVFFFLMILTLVLYSSGDQINYNPPQIHVGDNVAFSVVPINPSINFTFTWNFGDGTPQVVNANPVHSFKEPGTYNVTCEKKNGNDINNLSVSITVTDIRQVNATGSNFKVGVPVEFEAHHFGDSNLRWDFGDGIVENGPKNRTHIYSSQGNYNVKVKDYGGNSNTEIICTVNIAPDNREITFTPASPRAGQEVNFEAHNFASTNLKWEFGNVTENGGASKKHTFTNQGNFTIKVTDMSIGNSSFVTKDITILPDNRNITFSPPNPGIYEEVTFTALNFSSPNIKWDFDRGQVKNSGSSVEKFTFNNTGQYQIKAKESGSDMSFKTITLNISQDKRKIVITPPSVKVGSQVTIKLENSSVNTVNWIIGQERKNGSPKQIPFQFKDPGNFTIVSEITGQTPVTKNILVSDNRKIIMKRRVAFSGSELTFNTLNFNTPNLKWDFGDGTILNAGKSIKHKFINPGNYSVKVFDFNGQSKKPVELRVNVRADNRSIGSNYEVLFTKAEIEFSAKNFGDNRVKWDFGDGTIRRGGARMKHVFRSPGSFRVSAVDFDGTDSKKIEKMFNVGSDRRSLSISGEMLTGVPVDIELKNARGGNFVWKIAGGAGGGGVGPLLNNAKFDTPGNMIVTIIDRSGKYPPFIKKITVIPDPRVLKLSMDKVLPGEKVKLTAFNFRGNGVEWNFGDGTPPVVSSKVITHKFKNTGVFKVVVKDLAGKGKKLFEKSVRVSEILPGFDIGILELLFDNGKYYRVIPKSSSPPSYKIRFKAKGRGLLRGKWLLDGDTFGQFSIMLYENSVAALKKSELPRLPIIDLGIHELTFKFLNYNYGKSVPILKYFVSNGSAIEIISPIRGSKLVAGEKVTLKWRLKKENQKFEVAVSQIPFRFIEDKQVHWQNAGHKNSFVPDLSQYKKGQWIFWMVRVVDSSGTMINSSETAEFKISGN